MRAKVILLRQNGTLLGRRIDVTKAPSKDVLAGHLTMTRGEPMQIRSENSSPGKGLLAALYAPTLVSIEVGWQHFRGFEKAVLNELECGVLQEWIVVPAQS